jgi:hypothetical protein
MDWRDRVPACFGDQDLVFASDPTDEAKKVTSWTSAGIVPTKVIPGTCISSRPSSRLLRLAS